MTTPLLDNIEFPADLRQVAEADLPQVADELREFLLQSVCATGGHFASNLGAVELTVALHYVYNTPSDHLVWDVGHQSYPHKILTGRKSRMGTMRQQHGLAGFPKRCDLNTMRLVWGIRLRLLVRLWACKWPTNCKASPIAMWPSLVMVR